MRDVAAEGRLFLLYQFRRRLEQRCGYGRDGVLVVVVVVVVPERLFVPVVFVSLFYVISRIIYYLLGSAVLYHVFLLLPYIICT